jgi:hypothetical protein
VDVGDCSLDVGVVDAVALTVADLGLVEIDDTGLDLVLPHHGSSSHVRRRPASLSA